MKSLSGLTLSIDLTDARFWLLSLGSGLIAIHLTLAWRVDDANLLMNGLIFWMTIAHLIWLRRYDLTLKTSAIASLVGAVILAIVLVKSTAITGAFFLRLYPFAIGIAIALLASGFRGIKQYTQELVLLFFLGVPEVLISTWIDLTGITARFSTLLLWYAGFDVVRQGVNIYLPGGSVEVYYGCSGIQSVMQLLGLAVFVLVTVPLRWSWEQKIGLPLLAMAIAFVVNCGRVALMAVLLGAGRQQAFDYWHEGDGSLIFSAVAVLLFILLCFGLLRQHFVATPSTEVEP